MQKKKKIMILTDSLLVDGGATNVAIKHAIDFSKKHNVFYCYLLNKDNSSKYPFSRYRLNLKIPLFNSNFFSYLFGIINPISFLSLSYFLIFKQRGFNEIHIHTWVKGLSPIIILPAVFFSRAKLILFNHDYFQTCPNGVLFDFSSNEICNIKSPSVSCLTKQCTKLNMLFKVFIFLRFIIFKSCYFLLSKYYSERLSNIYVSDESRKIICTRESRGKTQNVVLDNRVKKNSRRVVIENNKIMAYIGRLSIEKGTLFLSRFAAKYRKEIFFIGKGKDILINKYALNEGWKDDSELKKFYTKLRYIIIPGQIMETDGLVIKEAGVLGIPCIISSRHIKANEVKDNNLGILFTDETSLMSALSLANQTEVAKSQSINCYKYYNSKYAY